jgi:hypothetical protein
MAKLALEGVDRYRVTDPVFESVRVVLAYLGESYSPDYVQGIAGGAFRIGGICPCAPTSSNAMWPAELVGLLGYTMQHLKLSDAITTAHYSQPQPLAKRYDANDQVLPDPDAFDDADLQAMCEQAHAIIAAVKAQIRAGRPAILWHAFTTAEFDVVAGFDEEAGTFLGWGSYGAPEEGYAEAPWGRTITTVYIGGQPEAILIGERERAFDARSAELAALREGVRHARSQKNVDKLGGEAWVMLEGLACYDRWIDDWRDPEKKRTMGDAYCLGVYRSTHRVAAGFLREIAPGHPAAADHLARAAGHFAAEADALDACVPLVWWEAPEGPDPERNAKTVPLLQRARDAYARGIDEIEAGLAALG